ncbi:Clp protease N-terminal domain-containing protein [Pseudofrankia inefficax]|uniref:Clp domain protein n=1 Tax=Pseudofrankia inefficax (strain DSM 45817 / CECT 9037 / DDB 130130 / EuI1c) TaxID=298654 RepID=E3J672_PSEI1|nr:Clp protease N-terminal domain-containing protein [Pseudofrankia inefficax]ADP78363.1 Clp domain protein [Pseudofrankia inefficax]
MEIAEQIIAAVKPLKGDELHQLSAAAWQVARIQIEADVAMRMFVEQALEAGASWVEVGGLLGIGHRAARERFGPESTASVAEPFSHYTKDASDSVTAASREARTLGSPYLGTEHLLLGLLGQPGSRATRVLEWLDVSHASIRDAVNEETVHREAPSAAHLAFTGRAQAVLQTHAPREMSRAQAELIDTDILLLALLADEGGIARRVLESSGVTADRVRSWRAQAT